ncbi:unnamed protein product [Lupinus luteus]|uniref:CBF1-interacting co-repressor CIR N-terminal domain-containing protein n=1 Tax=Lupinus luteus TaxID=3873 RepID=A0AAV1WVS0_LUPLU
MGGHGGLNILPQKRWNVYRYDNREKVRRDEEEAAREEQIKRDQARKQDAEFRLERLRTSKGLAPLIQAEAQANEHESHCNETEQVTLSSPKSGHINLFEGIKIFDPIREPEKDVSGEKERVSKKLKKMKKEEVVVTPEDEKYRFGYSYLGKQVKLPWYLEKRNDDVDGDGESSEKGEKSEKNKRGRKTLEELREERLKREKVEKERERALIHGKQKSVREPFGSSRFYRR